jgi:hypothetical protein
MQGSVLDVHILQIFSYDIALLRCKLDGSRRNDSTLCWWCLRIAALANKMAAKILVRAARFILTPPFFKLSRQSDFWARIWHWIADPHPLASIMKHA